MILGHQDLQIRQLEVATCVRGKYYIRVWVSRHVSLIFELQSKLPYEVR